MKILIVDDEASVLSELNEFLTELGHDVVTAANGRQALEVVERGSIDAVASDVKMPEMDGITLLKNLATRHPGVPVILFSGYQEVEDIIAAVTHRAYGYLKKPFKLLELRERLERIEAELRRRRRLSRSRLYTKLDPATVFFGLLAASLGHEVERMNDSLLERARLHEGRPKRASAGEESCRRTMEAIRRDAEQIGRAARQMKRFAHPVSFEFQSVDLRQCLDAALESLEPAVPAGLAIVREYPPEPVVTSAFHEAILQIAAKLLRNAFEALSGRKDGTIVMASARDRDRVKFSIRNNGPAMRPEIEGGLFEPAVSDKSGGIDRGMGLNLAAGLVRSLGGSIAYARENEWTVFTVTLPLEDEE